MKMVCWWLLGMSLAAQQSIPRVTVRVLNPAEIPPKTLQRAEHVATAIFGHAGVEMVWLPCPPCAKDLGPGERWLHLLTRGPRQVHEDALGFAVLTPERDGAANYGGVYWQQVRQAASTLEADEAALLGAAMAHELGHVLLRSHAHAGTGVMCSRFQRAEARLAASGELRFLPGEAQGIRAGVMSLTPPPP